MAAHSGAADAVPRPEAASSRRRQVRQDALQTQDGHPGHPDAAQSQDGHPEHPQEQSVWGAWDDGPRDTPEPPHPEHRDAAEAARSTRALKDWTSTLNPTRPCSARGSLGGGADAAAVHCKPGADPSAA